LAVIIFFAGFRFEIGYDYPKYLAGYMFDDELKHWEPFFNFFVRVIREVDFGLGIQFMFFFFSAITILILYKALRSLTPHYRFGVLLYLLIPALFLNSFSVIRQAIALVILLYGFQYIAREKPDYKHYLLVALTASMFHYSSLFVSSIFIVGTFFFRKIHSWVFYSFTIVISFFISFVHIGKMALLMLPGHFSSYANNFGYSVSPLKLLIINVFFLFLLSQKDKFLDKKLDIYLFNSIFIGLLIFNVFSDFAFVSRLAQYFLAAEIILVPIYLYSIEDLFLRKVMSILFLLYYLFNFNYTLLRDIDVHNIKSDPHTLTPYKNYFFETPKSYREQNLKAWYNYIQETVIIQEKQEDIQ